MLTNPGNTQALFFQHLRKTMPPHLSMVDELADLLEISADSAYRRIRGEKPISLEEIRAICIKYNLSFDQFLHIKSNTFVFSGKLMQDEQRAFEDWLDNLLQQAMYMGSLQDKHIYWLLKDIPPISHFLIPELAVFKFYFWTKSILQYTSMRGVKFDPKDSRYDEYLAKTNIIAEQFNKIPTTEIWNLESINSSLRQIRFHVEAGSFKSMSDAINILEKLNDLINHYEAQAEAGIKFKVGSNVANSDVGYTMLVNELILGDNTAFFTAGDLKLTFLNHSVLYFMHTVDEQFNSRMFRNLDNLMKKSTMISKVSEKERFTFFNALREQVAKTVEYVNRQA
jgi:hypothetical protein